MLLTVPQYTVLVMFNQIQKTMIRGIGISFVRNHLNQYPVHLVMHYATINQKNHDLLCAKDRAQHEKKCRLEAEYRFQIGRRSPDPKKVTADQWTHLFDLPSANQRRIYSQYLYDQQARSCKSNVEKVIRNEIIDLKRQMVIEQQKENCHLVYGLGHNFYLPRLPRQQMAKWMNLRMHRAKLFGQKMIIDCGFDDRMSARELRDTAWKLEKCYTENRTHKLPFDLYYFGGKSNNYCLDRLTKQIPSLIETNSMTEVHYDKCYTDYFPKERLVMLTPDSPNIIEYNFDDIYVVGGIVDKGAHEPITLSKAKRLDLRTARLPLHHLPRKWQLNPEIPLDAVVAILRERQIKMNWRKILELFISKPEIKAAIVERKRYSFRKGSEILKYEQKN